MKNFLKQFFNQCARPEGFLGRLMLRFMNFGHAPLTNWGLSFIDFGDRWMMLDIGCGGGATLQRLLKRSEGAKVYGIDISKESIAKAKKVNSKQLDSQVFISQGSALNLPYSAETFDLITAVETVYFWLNLPKCLREVNRVLKKGGSFVIMMEVVKSKSVWANVIEGMTVYSPDELKHLLKEAGFVNIQIYYKKPSYVSIIGAK